MDALGCDVELTYVRQTESFDNRLDLKELIKEPVQKDRWVQIGSRDFDPGETAFIQKNRIAFVSAEENCCYQLEQLLRTDRFENIYIHLDLDVLDPEEGIPVPLPVDNGMTMSNLFKMLQMIQDAGTVVGMGVFEYKPTGREIPKMNEILTFAEKSAG